MLDAPWIPAFAFGVLAAASLPIGAAAGIWLRPSVRLTAAVMAFGAGALLAAMSFELVQPALERAGFLAPALGISLGCALFVGLNHLLNGQGAFLRKTATITEFARGAKRKKVEEAIDELSRVDIFRSLPPEEVQALVPFISPVSFPAGELIFDQGDPGDALYIIEEGTVAIMRTDDGRATPLAHLGAGETFGEMALLGDSDSTRMAAAVAVESCRLWKVHQEHFQQLIEASPALRESVVRLRDERRERTQAIMTAEEWRSRAMGSVDREAFHPTPMDVQSVVRAARNRGSAGLAIWLGSGLDGVGESVMIGATTLGAAVSMPLVGGVFLANLPESMSSAATMRRQGMPAVVIFALWMSLVLAGGVFAAAGSILLAGTPPASFAFVEGLAAGAILSMIAQTMLPEAFEHGGGPTVALMTVAGFLASILLGIFTGHV